LFFSEGAIIELAQSQKKLAECENKANYEDALVQRLETIREGL
jgi:hypothetical protein